MPKRIFDSNVLISHWKNFPDGEGERTEEALQEYASQLIEFYATDLICWPVLIEVLAGTQNKRDLDLHRAYLNPFKLIDQRNTPEEVWDKAKQFAQRVHEKDFDKARDFGDCLIQAIAEHYHCDLISCDKGCLALRAPRRLR